MNLFTPSETTLNYAKAGKAKAENPAVRTLRSSLMGGALIAFGAMASNTAAYGAGTVSLARLVSGLLFPFGLGMIILMGAELFTGNCLISISVMSGGTTPLRMVRNWILVYAGNFAGALSLAAAAAFFGQLDYSGGALALYTVKIAASKCALTFSKGVVMGFLCNVLVCAGVLCSLTAQDTVGRIAGAYIPVSLFVICGFEHSIANMYYVPAGIFAMQIPEYAKLAADAGVNAAALSWRNFFVHNLFPVTAGNILGGVFVGWVMWKDHGGK